MQVLDLGSFVADRLKCSVIECSIALPKSDQIKSISIMDRMEQIASLSNLIFNLNSFLRNRIKMTSRKMATSTESPIEMS